MKKPLIMALLATMVLPLAACGHDEPINYSDKDYDGLYDSVDPTPENNISGFQHNDSSRGLSNEILIPVDYRNFIFDNEPVFNNDAAMMAAVIANYSYKLHQPEYSILTSKYENEESGINKMLVQFGFNNVEHVELLDFEEDKYDTCGFFFGNHVVDYNGKLHQIICVSVDGYASNSAWYSNFDIGADDPIYAELGGTHSYWLNRNNHKGFDVTANRAYPEILKYAEKVNKKEYAEQIFLVIGHSRGGALTQLFGKKLKDDNKKSVAYAFNGCNVTTDDDSITKSYSNIFNVFSIHDFVSYYPVDFMGFKKYGKMYSYDLLSEQGNEYYNSLYNHDFNACTYDEMAELGELYKYILGSTRADMYKYREKDDNYPEYESASSYLDAEERLESMEDDIEFAALDNYVKCEIVENEDSETMEESPYLVQYYTRPATLLRLAGSVISRFFDSSLPIISVISTLAGSIKFVSRTVGMIVEKGIPTLELDKYILPHLQKTCIAGAHVAKLGE